MSAHARPRFALALLLTALLPYGCSQDAPVAPSRDGGTSAFSDWIQFAADRAQGGPRASLRNIWPNDDGREWTYRIDQREWSAPPIRSYPTAVEVPAIPSLDDVAALLGNHPIGTDPVETSGGYRLKFNGTKTTLSGATGQNLEASVFDLGAGSARLGVDAANVAATPGFIRALVRARPDLREKIQRRWPEAARGPLASGVPPEVSMPLFLFGSAFEKTREYIGSYGDLNLDLSWKYLEANLQPGSEFSMQLIPDLADNVFLHVRVLREVTAVTALGNIPRSIEVLYMVDYGVSEATDQFGNPIGYSGAFGYGAITYAPRVGPVASYERPFVDVGEPLHPGYGDQTISIMTTAAGQALLSSAP
jgi:hypothetical protein